ncbi:MAG: alginate lyase family protein [Gemmatimonadota bacterium]|nr:alginate lyase family protein [Gemmatimonadota bacterium]
MSPGEILSRLGTLLSDRWLRLTGAPESAAGKVGAGSLLPLLNNPLVYEPAAGELKKSPWAGEIVRRADEVLEGRWLVFGQTVQLDRPVDWLKDPFLGLRADQSSALPLFGFSRLANGADIRSIWELNRLQGAVELGRAWQLTGERKYAAGVGEIVRCWSAANPYLATVNWTNALEVAFRTLSLIQAVSAVRDSSIARDESKIFAEEASRLLYLHGRYLGSHLSRGSTAHNHLAGEAAALMALGRLLPGLPGAGRWYTTGRKALSECVGRLILPDGGGREGSLHYLALVCRLVVSACTLTGEGRTGAETDFLEEGGHWRRERLGEAYRFLCSVTDGGRSISEFGDSDDAGPGGPPPAGAISRYRAALNQLYLFLPGQELLHEFEPDPDSLWLFGPEKLEAAAGRVHKSRTASKTVERFGHSGHWVVRLPETGSSPRVFLRFECGHWGAAKTWAHAHADRLSFSLFLDGKPFFIDPGTGAYLAHPGWREYFRSSAAHNTATVDGYSQNEPSGAFFWKQELSSRLLLLDESGDEIVLEGEHYGFKRAMALIHRRRVVLQKGAPGLKIVDTFMTDRHHQAALYFNLHPQCGIEKKEQAAGIFSIVNSGQNASFIGDERFRVSFHRGEDAPLMRGWFSPGFMRREPCWQIVCDAGLEGRTEFITEMSWGKTEV